MVWNATPGHNSCPITGFELGHRAALGAPARRRCGRTRRSRPVTRGTLRNLTPKVRSGLRMRMLRRHQFVPGSDLVDIDERKAGPPGLGAPPPLSRSSYHGAGRRSVGSCFFTTESVRRSRQLHLYWLRGLPDHPRISSLPRRASAKHDGAVSCRSRTAASRRTRRVRPNRPWKQKRGLSYAPSCR